MKDSYSEQQRLYYNKRAKKIVNRRLFTRENRNHFKKIMRVIRVAEKIEPETVLEIGTGTGIHAYWFLEKLQKKVKLIGVDISENMLKEAESRLASYIKKKLVKLIRADALSLPLRDNSFGLVFCSGTLHHIDKPHKAIQEMVRVLRPGGSLVIIEPNSLSPVNILSVLIEPMERNILKMRKNNFFTWTNELLEQIEVENFNYTPSFPESLSKFYDKVDEVLHALPLVRNLSIMLCLSGKKKDK